jgi:exopolysaccharide biosynthesis operon protein EpsL
MPLVLHPNARFFAVCATLAAASAQAHAVNGDTFTPYVRYTRAYQDNPLLLRDRATALAVSGSEDTSETTSTTTAGIKFDKEYLRQLIKVDLNVAKSTHDRYRRLDNTSRGYDANWTWHAFDNLDGNLISTYSRAPAPNEDFRQASAVLRTQRFDMFEAGYLVTPSWRVRGNVSRYTLGYGVEELRPFDLTLNTALVGIDFLPATGSTFGLQTGRTRGGYPNAPTGVNVQNGSYTLNEFKGLAKWKFTPQTDFQFLGGWVNRSEDNAASKDFSGLNARLTSNWAPTAKLSFSAAAFQEFAAAGDLVSNYTLNRGFSASSVWNVTFHSRLEAGVRTEKRDYNGIATILNTSAQNRDDRFRTLQLASIYQPTSHIKITVGLFKTIADSNIDKLGYRAKGAAISAQYAF